MSIRITLLTLLVIGLAVYAWRDWYVSLCGLILLMAVMEHPDMLHAAPAARKTSLFAVKREPGPRCCVAFTPIR